MIVGLLAGNGLHATFNSYFFLDVVEDSLNLGSVGARRNNEIIGDIHQIANLDNHDVGCLALICRTCSDQRAFTRRCFFHLFSPLLFLRLGTVVPVPNRNRIITDGLAGTNQIGHAFLQHRIEQLF